MGRVRYTASGRLGVWNSVDKPGLDKWQSKLDKFLRSNAHGVIESDVHAFTETDDLGLAAITAVCDKIIARGNPTLVDPNWERTILRESGSEFLCWEKPDEPEINFCVKEFLLPEGSSFHLLDAAKDLLDLGWDHQRPAHPQQLPIDLQKLCGFGEDILYAGLIRKLGVSASGAIQRQSLISDLVKRQIPRELTDNRVDFALQMSRARWVIEVDGSSKLLGPIDALRDDILRKDGWRVCRVGLPLEKDKAFSALNSWIQQAWTDAKPENLLSLDIGSTWQSVVTALGESAIHRAAWHLLLRPLAVQRCLRALLLLYRHGTLDATRPQRILVVEEDMPAVADAFQMLRERWELIFWLQPELGVGPPEFLLDVIGEKGLQETGHNVQYVDRPEGDYDAVISHSLLLSEGYPGPLLTQVAPTLTDDSLRIRRSIGRRTDRYLQESRGFNYQLDDGCEIQENALRRLLQIVFRKREFRDGQLKSISRLLRGDSTIVLLPTGGGKSLIYQFTGMLLPGMTVIVDPIISLMDDQMYNLKRMGIDRIEDISSQRAPAEKKKALQRMSGGELSYVFISPERFQSKEFRDQLQQVKPHVPISLAVLDEAHCISEWGHDFRPAYLRLPKNLQDYCKDKDTGAFPTVAALTGTASYAVLEDIQAELELNDEDAIIRPASLNRRELCFDVRQVSPESRAAELQLVREEMPGRWNLNPQEFFQSGRGNRTECGLVFCPHVNGKIGVVAVAAELGHANYYAGKAPKTFVADWNKYKQDTQSKFIRSEIQELVATKAFGMGIDKPNIRYTVHFVAPSSVEQFYQEAGRAGRNGQKGYALCTVIYCHSDKKVNEWFLSNSHKGRDTEKKCTFELWQRWLKSAMPKAADVAQLQLHGDWLAGKPGGSLKTVQIPFGGDQKIREKCIYRLAVLGIVEDYTVDWNKNWFDVNVRDADADMVRASLSNYVGRYKFPDYVDKQLSQVCASDASVMVEQAIGVLVDFIYDEVVAKRKQAIQNMAELCQDYRDSKSFRDEILAYLEESEFTELLNSWRGRSLKDIGLATVRGVLADLDKLEIGDTKGRLRALIGTTRRMLEADPGNLALRYLSVIARFWSPWQSDSSVMDETEILLAEMGSEESEAVQLRFELLKDVLCWRRGIAVKVTRAMVSGGDGLRFARRILAGGQEFSDGVRLVALEIVSSNVVKTVSGSNRFYNTLALKSVMPALDSTLRSVLGVSQFHDLELLGGQYDAGRE